MCWRAVKQKSNQSNQFNGILIPALWRAAYRILKQLKCDPKLHLSRPVWSESSLSTWRKLGSLATHWAHSEDSDQTGRMPRLFWVFAGRTATLLVLSRGGSFAIEKPYKMKSTVSLFNWNSVAEECMEFFSRKVSNMPSAEACVSIRVTLIHNAK